MSKDPVGKIKIESLKITTKSNGETKRWSAISGDESKFIVYRGKIYKLISEEDDKYQ